MYTDLKLFSINVKTWKFCGYLDFNTTRRSLIIIIIPIISFVLQLCNVYHTWGDFVEEIFTMFMVSVNLTSLARYFHMIYNGPKYVKFFESIEKLHNDAERSGDERILLILNETTAHSQMISKFSCYLAFIGSMAVSTYPAFLTKRKFAMDIYCPFFDIYQSPQYEIIYALQITVYLFFAITMYIFYQSVFVAFVLFPIGLLRILAYQLQKISDIDESKMVKGLKDCILLHQKIIEYCDDLQEIISPICFLDLVMCASILCVTMYLASILQDTASIVTVFIMISEPFYVLTLTYWYANKLATESLKISECVYDLPWFYGNKEFRKCTHIMLTRSQKPLQLTAGGIYPMTMENYQAILRVSYSYFSLLKGLAQE